MTKNNKSKSAGIIGLVLLLAIVAAIFKVTTKEAKDNEVVQAEQPQ